MGKKKIQPHLVFADYDGNIYDHPDLLMLARKGNELVFPHPDELLPLPEGSDLYLLPQRMALGFDAKNGQLESEPDAFAVAAFVCPGYTLSATAAYKEMPGAPALPLFSYGAVGFANDRFWVCAKQVDKDRRQVFANISTERIKKGASCLLHSFPENRLIDHLSRCALTFCCPAAKNLALGRFEAPIPTSRVCNAHCIGCISKQEEGSGFPAPQNRISFRPTADEILELLQLHGRREKKRPIYSFGQGCEGEPLLEAPLIQKAILQFRLGGGIGTININTNASLPQTILPLAQAGLSSIRVSINSARPEVYERYYRPANYTFADILSSIREAKSAGLFVSLNYLFFPGINDTEAEFEALASLVSTYQLDFIQMRNLSLDPEIYLAQMNMPPEPSMGLKNFMKRLKKACPWIQYGYFNPFLVRGAKSWHLPEV